MSHVTTMKTTRETLDRLRPYANFRDSWDSIVNKVLDIAEDKIQGEKHESEHVVLFKEINKHRDTCGKDNDGKGLCGLCNSSSFGRV